ncbi:hypothetical protein [Vibrio sp. CAU 1672]|uniref:hypothetical protein n=1 Tax=Vibrio sp. CAU 1672 TaxID=3032594 RepID=UPI0023DA0840|nr:hypothetical protein [Vibrio sp. CAU 1672]MDF2152714.1 hypothetical protein [Vibrio sp. CAU 1672]
MWNKNRTLLMTGLCLTLMLLTSFAASVVAGTKRLDNQRQAEVIHLHQPLGVNSECVDLKNGDHQLMSKQTHTSCSSLCIIKMPLKLSSVVLGLWPYRLALIDKLPSPKVIAIVTKPFRPPIV